MITSRRYRKFHLAIFFVLVLAPLVVSAATPGEQVQFFIESSFDTKSRSQITATLRVEGEHAHYYVEDEYWQGLGAEQAAFATALSDLAREFDTNIYPIERQVFGFEPNPGIDGDPKITVLVTPLVQDAGGYFLIANEFPKTRHAQSNERDLVHINAASYRTGRWREFLAHEFQHLITFGAKEQRLNKNEEVWLNELRSEYAVTAAGYDDASGGINIRQRASAFARNPSDGLIDWQNKDADYASINLFGQYLVENYGLTILRETIENASAGIASIEDALKARGLGKTFADLYGEWVATNFAGGYKNSFLQNFRLVPETMYNIFGSFTIGAEERVPSWSIKSLGAKTAERGLELNLQSEPNEEWLLLVIKKDKPTERLLAFRFAGPKTIQVSTPGPEDQNVVVVPVNITDRIPKRDAPARLVSYTLTIKTLAEAPSPAPPSTSPTPTVSPLAPSPPPPSPSLSPTPTPTPTPIPQPSLPPPSFPDGTLIRGRGDTRVWIVSGNYARHITHPAIFGMYRHIRWEDVREVEPGTVARFRISALVRAPGDDKVYEIDAAGAKHWLNVTPEQFVASGRDWNAVYVVNAAERDFYVTGAPTIQ